MLLVLYDYYTCGFTLAILEIVSLYDRLFLFSQFLGKFAYCAHSHNSHTQTQWHNDAICWFHSFF